ncbi:hypothetical protein QUB30_27910 [Microcoleus sp. BROC3]
MTTGTRRQGLALIPTFLLTAWTVVCLGFCSLAIAIDSGALQSVHRYAYGIVSLSIGLGLVLSSQPRWDMLL